MDAIRNWLELFGSTGPAVSLGLIYGLSLMLLTVGLTLLLWGRLFSRIVMALALAGVGVLAAGPVAPAVELDLLYVRIGCGVVGAIAGALLAPICWGLLGGALAAAGAATCVLLNQHPDVPPELADTLENVAAADLATWAAGLGDFVWQSLHVAAAGSEAVFFASVSAAGLIVLIPLTIKMRLATSLVSALLGSAGVVAGATAISLAIRPELWQAVRMHFYVPGGIIAAVWAFGAAYQMLRSRDRRDGEEQDDGDEAAPTKTSRSDAGTDRRTKKARRKSSQKAE